MSIDLANCPFNSYANKIWIIERETQLRLIRNAIRVAEGEQSALKSTIDRVEVNHSALTAQVEEGKLSRLFVHFLDFVTTFLFVSTAIII